MKLYVIMTMESDGDGVTTIIWHRYLYLFKDQAFEAAITMPNSCVIEMKQTDSWNLEQMLENKTL